MTVVQWLKGEPLLEQVLFILLGGFFVMLFCQLFLGMGALGSQPRLRAAPSEEYEHDKIFGMHPVEKILIEETGVSSAAEAKPLLKAWWAAKIADMSPEEIEKLKVQHLYQPKLEELERRFPGKELPKPFTFIYNETEE